MMQSRDYFNNLRYTVGENWILRGLIVLETYVCASLCFFYVAVSLTIMKTKVMVMKMLARATTLWSAEMAMVMAVAV